MISKKKVTEDFGWLSEDGDISVVYVGIYTIAAFNDENGRTTYGGYVGERKLMCLEHNFDAMLIRLIAHYANEEKAVPYVCKMLNIDRGM